MTHALLYDSHELKLFARATLGHVIFTDGHMFRLLSIWIRHEHRERELHTHFVVALAQFLQLLFCNVQFLTGIKTDRVDDAVRVDVFTVCMRTDENLMTTEILSQLQSCGVSNSGIDIGALWEALHHVVEHRTVRFMVQRFC